MSARKHRVHPGISATENQLTARADGERELAAAARIITRFTESEREILRTLLRADWNTGRAALLAGKSVERVSNVVQKLRATRRDLNSLQMAKPTRVDFQEAVRARGRHVAVDLGQDLVRLFSKAPLRIKLRVMRLLTDHLPS